MTIEKRREILKAYLGRFYVPFNQGLRNRLTQEIPETAHSILCCGSSSLFTEVGQYFLLRRRKHLIYRVITLKELMDIQMSSGDDSSIYDLKDSLVIVKWFRGHMSSKLDMDMLTTFIDFRNGLSHRDTVVYTDRDDWDSVVEFFDAVFEIDTTVSKVSGISGKDISVKSDNTLSSADSEI